MQRTTDNGRRTFPRYANRLALLLSAASFLAAFATLDDFGLTIDEPINLGHGRTISEAVLDRPRLLLTPDGIGAVWEDGREHPPLTRFLIGVGGRVLDPPNAKGLNLKGGRATSAAAYAGIVFLVVRHASLVAGLLAGIGAGLAVATLPRLFAHSHLASPEVISAFFMLWAWIAAGKAILDPKQPPFHRILAVVFAGFVLGLALLSKLTAVLVPFTVFVAVLMNRGPRALPMLAGWSLVGGLVFFAGWPWLWPVDLPGRPAGFAGSIERFREFLATGTKRASIYVWYFGRQYPGNLAPWHFAPLFFALTTPVVVLVLGTIGAWQSSKFRAAAPKRFSIVVAFLGSLAVFCLPIQRYDGERLFLFVFPLWCILAGIGAAWIVETKRFSRNVKAAMVLLPLALPIIEIRRLHPHSLSYYNLLVGGLPGADRLGLEPTYWGDSITPRLLEKLAAAAEENDFAVLAPTLYSGHADAMTSPGLAAKRIAILPADRALPPGAPSPPDAEPAEEIRWAILFHRTGYLIDPVPSNLLQQGETIAEEAVDGAWLARVVRLPPGWRVLRAVR